jgi:LPXTG-motif cell wall-anchored protein
VSYPPVPTETVPSTTTVVRVVTDALPNTGLDIIDTLFYGAVMVSVGIATMLLFRRK